MADTEKIYCSDPNCTAMMTMLANNQRNSPAEMAALMNMSGNNGFGGGSWNNPFAYILFMWLMRFMNGGWNGNMIGNGYGLGVGENFNSRQISQIHDQLNNNQNSNLLMDAIKGNASAIADLSNATNINYNTLSQALCGVRSSIEAVGGQVGYTAERVINAVNLGDTNIIQNLKDCCCRTQTSILSQGYENQLATERQTNVLGSKMDVNHAANQLQECQQTNALTNAINTATWNITSGIDSNKQTVINGFANIGYDISKNTSAIIQAINSAQQKTNDQLALHWQAETSQSLQDAKNEISQLKQTQVILSALGNNGGCNCN